MAPQFCHSWQFCHFMTSLQEFVYCVKAHFCQFLIFFCWKFENERLWKKTFQQFLLCVWKTYDFMQSAQIECCSGRVREIFQHAAGIGRWMGSRHCLYFVRITIESLAQKRNWLYGVRRAYDVDKSRYTCSRTLLRMRELYIREKQTHLAKYRSNRHEIRSIAVATFRNCANSEQAQSNGRISTTIIRNRRRRGGFNVWTLGCRQEVRSHWNFPG